MRLYKDLPQALDKLYTDQDYIHRTHGHDLQIHMDQNQSNMQVNAKRRRRQVLLIKDSFGAEECSSFEKLHLTFQELIDSQPEDCKVVNTVFEMAELFMKVSGDIGALKEHMAGRRVTEWTYLDDMALTMPETSTEHRCLLTTKGREEIEKRQRFLLNWNNNPGQSDEASKMEVD